MTYEYINTYNIPADPTSCTNIFLGYLKDVDNTEVLVAFQQLLFRINANCQHCLGNVYVYSYILKCEPIPCSINRNSL